MASSFQDFLNKYAKGDDNKITKRDIKDFAARGGSQKKAEKYLSKIENQQDKKNKAAFGIKIGDKAFTAASKASNFGLPSSVSVTPSDNASAGGASGYSGTDIDVGVLKDLDDYYTANKDFLAQGLYNNNELITKIKGKYLAYGADQDRLARENVASIQGEYSLDLQEIVNAGARDVEKIRGEYGLEGEKLRGEYGLEMERLRGDTARDVASRQKDAQVFGSLLSGFWT